MKVSLPSKQRRAISGILAGIILFAMLFSVGMAFFTYQNTLTNQYDHANALYQSFGQAKVSEAASILAYPNKPGNTLNVSAVVSNVGTNYVNLTAIFLEDQTGRIACFSPLMGGITNCNPYFGHTLTKVILPKTILNVGGATNITTDIRSTDASISSCSTKNPCFFGLMTSRGNVFTGLYPGPLVSTPVVITTTLNSTVISPGGYVKDTALLSGVSANAGGTVKYYYFTNGLCSLGQTLVSTQTVTNGVVPNSDVGQPTGTQFSSTGSYSWYAVYSGDVHNAGATSACEPLSVYSANILNSLTAQGLGSIALDFNSFKVFTVGACNVGPSVCTLSPWNAGGGIKNNPNLAYTGLSKAGLSASHPVFSVNITNADPQKRQIVLDKYTQVLFFDPTSGAQPSGVIFEIVNVNLATHQTQVGVPSVTINYLQTVTIFFGVPAGGSIGNLGSPPVLSSDFLFFHGTVGPIAMGQNIPYATSLWNA